MCRWIVINDLYQDWKGKIRFRILHGRKVLSEQTCSGEVAALGQTRLSFSCAVPTESGDYQLEAALCDGARSRGKACVISE